MAAEAPSVAQTYCPFIRGKCRRNCMLYVDEPLVEQAEVDIDFMKGCSLYLAGLGVAAHLAGIRRLLYLQERQK